MRSSYKARRLARRNRKPSELLLVPMIDIFTVLVTFLLMTAVFSRTVIIELKLPTQSSDFVEPPPGLELEVLLLKDRLVAADRATGPLQTFLNAENNGEYNFAGLSSYLQQVKARYPDKTDATLLLEPETPYDLLVQAMDSIRIVEQRQGTALVQGELFPNVSIGDAPSTDAGTAPAVAPAGARR